MKRAEHIEAAERYLHEWLNLESDNPRANWLAMEYLGAAQVHATLAASAAPRYIVVDASLSTEEIQAALAGLESAE